MDVKQGSTIHLMLRYSYDDVGNITKIEDLKSLFGIGGSNVRDTQNFAYDELNCFWQAKSEPNGRLKCHHL